jgi:hypothetical protein
MNKQEKLAGFEGKWMYLWRMEHFNSVNHIVKLLKDSKTAGVVIKVHDGIYDWTGPEMDDLVDALVAADIRVGGWGYVYCTYKPLTEASMAIKAMTRYKDKMLFYLLDAEHHAKGQWHNADLFSKALKAGIGDFMPIGLNSYRFPHLHPTLPWKEFRGIADFDCPQVYWRGGNPSGHLDMSRNEFAKMYKLPYIPAGEMYSEHGVATSVAEINGYLTTCRNDPALPATVNWVLDQHRKLPAVWDAYSRFSWPVDSIEPVPVPVPPPAPPVVLPDIATVMDNYFALIREDLSKNRAKWEEALKKWVAGTGFSIDLQERAKAGIALAIKGVKQAQTPEIAHMYKGEVIARSVSVWTRFDNPKNFIRYALKGEKVTIYARKGTRVKISAPIDPTEWVTERWIKANNE